MSRPKWYQKPHYKKPLDRMELGDGSFVQVAPVDGSTLLLTRDYPDGTSERVRIIKDSHGSYSYDVAPRDRFGVAKEFIGDPDWKPPFVKSNAIPGTSPSSIETHDPITNRDYTGRKDLEDYYKNHDLALISAYEQHNFHERTPLKAPEVGQVNRNTFTGPRPVPTEGAKESVYKEDLTKVADWDY